MMNYIFPGRFFFLGFAVVLISGCATRSLYLDASQRFSEGYEAASSTLFSLIGTATRDARLQSIGHYIESGDSGNNLDSLDIPGSFARYVCAGFGRYDIEIGALATLETYNSHIATLSEDPSDDLGELIASIRSLRIPQPFLVLPDGVNVNAGDAESAGQSEAGNADAENGRVHPEDQCRADIRSVLPPVRSLDPKQKDPELERPEGVAAGLAGIFDIQGQVQDLVNGLQSAAVDILKIVDDAKRADALKNYVIQNQETVEEIFDGSPLTTFEGLDGSQKIAQAWRNHKIALLVDPYFRFKHMLLNIDRGIDIELLLDTEAYVHESLNAYDVIRLTPPPQEIVEAMREAQSYLVRLAKGELKPSEAWAVFVTFSESLKAIAGAIDTAAGSLQGL